jgi:hypothetical protein
VTSPIGRNPNELMTSPARRAVGAHQARDAIFFAVFAFVCYLSCSFRALSAPVPSPGRLLPDDTLFLITSEDFPRLRSVFDQSPQARLWDDPVFKPFKENFIAKWTDDIIRPLEHDLSININDYTNLAQGQFTIAFVNAGPEQGPGPGMLLLLDTKGKANQLKSNLLKLHKKWVDGGKVVRTEKIRDVEFLIVSLGTNEAPRTFQQFLPHSPEVQQLGAVSEAKKTPPKAELVIGRTDSLLIVGNSLKAAEKIVARLGGSGGPTLADSADYQANYSALFRDAPLYAWLNLKLMDQAAGQKPAEPRNGDSADPFPAVRQDRYLAASGLMGVRTLAISFRDSNEGALVQMNFSAPESTRQTLFKLPPNGPHDCGIPSFVPADAVKFQRWRLDGQKAWAAFEKFLSEASPQAFNGINAILDLANQNARQRDPSFDVRKNLIGNLGDDLITYEKVPRGASRPELEAPPSIALLSSPNPDQFVSALQSILIFMSAQADKPAEREFLGRKILSVPLPSLAIPFLETKQRPPRTIHYVASGGYVALSTDASMLEEFLRRSENLARPLRESSGLIEAAQRVLDPGTILFGFDNQSETYRAKFEQWKPDAASAANPSVPNLPIAPFNPGAAEKSVSDWTDFSLLPPFDAVSKYFHFSVYAVSAGPDGFRLKYFLATPPALRASPPAAVR